MLYLYALSFAAAVLMALLLTPVVKTFAVWIGAVDAPNHRKVHKQIMPRLGGLAIFTAFIASYFIIAPVLDNYKENAAWGLVVGGAVIVLVGALDDKFQLSAKWKLLGQVIAAGVVVIGFGLRVDILNIPFMEAQTNISMDWLSIAITMFWIVGVTNAINLIDGLDGLAGGVSAIATATILVLAIIMGNITVILLSTILLGSIIGFLFFNFYPAKIFMGDSGALFLGFALATLSVLGFKQATLVSFIAPLLMLGVPLADTFFAIVRRVVNRKPISVADKSHLHHCLLQLGMSHRMTVLVIYGIASIFGLTAVLLAQWDTALWLQVVVVAAILILIELGAEAVGIISNNKKPVLHFLRKLQIKTARFLGTRVMK